MAEGNADPVERRWFRQKIEELTQRLKTSTQKNERLRQENRRQKTEIWNFAVQLDHEKKQNTDLRGQVKRLYGQIKLMEKYEKQIYELQSQIKASISRVCGDDCTCCVIAKICENEELGDGETLCCPQLRTIISVHAGSKFEPKHSRCADFMDLLKKCDIAKEHYEFKYPPSMSGRENEMAAAFDELMKMDPSFGVVIIGRVISQTEGKGHSELCFLNTRTQDGKLTIHNPQTQTWGEGGLQQFIDHVTNDEGVILYTVIIEEIKKIYDKYSTFLHRNPSDQTLATATGDVDGDC